MLPAGRSLVGYAARAAALFLVVGGTVHTRASAAADGGSASSVERGKYVAIEADCMSCHSAPGGRPYAGGYPLKSPFGIIYGPNITADPQTGIGSWTRAEFEKALRQGVGKDGSYLYPAMPYENYTKMTAADMDALWAYMQSVPAVKNTPPKNTLSFPFNVRTGLAVWQGMYFKPGPFVPDAKQDAQWNRGAYLVQVMGHCNQCHTPRNTAQGLENAHGLGGATISGWYAPDISNDAHSQINGWSAEQLAKFLKSGIQPNNAKAVGPMQETVHDSLRLMTGADLTAIAVYLKKQPGNVEETATKANWAADRQAAGKLVYENNCSSCHQSNGKGIVGSVPALAGDGAVTSREPYNVVMATLEGFSPQGTWGAMGSFASLSDEQLADVANYIRTAWGNNAPPNATPWSVSTWRKTADAPKDETHQMLCPSLAADVVTPALKESPDLLKQAAGDRAKMSKVISDYRAARPATSRAQVVEALSTAYCRAVATDGISEARMSAQIAEFAQRVATALGAAKKSS